MKDYEFFDGQRRIKLSELFGDDKPYLFMYHVMYFQDDKEFCPMCSMWIDGLDGVAHHVMQRANIVAAMRDKIGFRRGKPARCRLQRSTSHGGANRTSAADAAV